MDLERPRVDALEFNNATQYIMLIYVSYRSELRVSAPAILLTLL